MGKEGTRAHPFAPPNPYIWIRPWQCSNILHVRWTYLYCVHREFSYQLPGKRIQKISPRLPNLLSNIKGLTFWDIVQVFAYETLWQHSDGNLFNGGVKCRWGIKKSQFLPNISLYLGNDTRWRHSYNGILIGSYTRPTLQCNFEQL